MARVIVNFVHKALVSVNREHWLGDMENHSTNAFYCKCGGSYGGYNIIFTTIIISLYYFIDQQCNLVDISLMEQDMELMKL